MTICLIDTVSDGGLHFLLYICFIVNNCLIYLLTSFLKVLSVFPKLARRIIKLSKYSTVFHMIKHIKKPHQFTPYSSLLPCISPSSVPIPLLLPLLCPQPSPCPFLPLLDQLQNYASSSLHLSPVTACCLDLGVFVFLFCLLPYFRGAYVLEVSQECTYEGEVLMCFFF